MRRLLALLGGIALVRAWLARRAVREAADPADELRRKLEESRELAADQEEFTAGETPVDLSPEGAGPSPGAPEDADDRRREVHERGRAAIDDMRGES